MLPESIARRPKQPYRAPIREVFPLGAAPDYVDELLSEQALRRAGYFNPVKAAGLARKVRGAEPASSGETQDMAFLGILSTQLIHHQYIESFAAREVRVTAPDKVMRG
jgi:asparagine synthase (glutamine-hydrolysing)